MWTKRQWDGRCMEPSLPVEMPHPSFTKTETVQESIKGWAAGLNTTEEGYKTIQTSSFPAFYQQHRHQPSKLGLSARKMAVSTHNPVFSRIWGHTLNIPDLTSLYSRWPSETSPYFEKLKHIVESKIQEWIPESDEHIRRKARKCDLAVFVST